MAGQLLSPVHKKENLRFFRRYLGLTQKEFISRFLSDAEGNPAMSIATLSNLESKGGSRLGEVVLTVSEAVGMDSMIFSMEPEKFAAQIDLLLPDDAYAAGKRGNVRDGTTKSNVSKILYRLTMYFAEEMFEGRLKKGDKTESDRELAGKLGVGRAAIREALKVLDVLGMIEIHPGQGTYISRSEANFFIIPLSWSLFLNNSQIEDILTVRNLLEVKGAGLAASFTDSEYDGRLREISARIQTAYEHRNYREFLEEDLEFHSCIAGYSRNTVIYSMNQTIRNLMKRVSGTGMVDERQLGEICREHQKICERILDGDVDGAQDAMREHLENSRKRYNYR